MDSSCFHSKHGCSSHDTLRTYPRQSNPSCWINWGGNPKEIEFNLSRERITDNH